MVKMSTDILNVINAVLDYKKFVISNNYVDPKADFDWFTETEKYYYSLPLPSGMEKSRKDFEIILEYMNTGFLNRLNNTESVDLQYEIWK